VLVLCDCPERVPGLVTAGGWEPVTADSLPTFDRAVWQALCGSDDVWRGRAPDPSPAGFWSHALVVEEAASSQLDVLRELLEGGLPVPGPTACLALAGGGFHGRHGRRWLAAPGNLQLAAVVPGPRVAAREARVLAALPALALVDAVSRLGEPAVRPGVRWVNDVLVDGRKVGGALTTTLTLGDRVSAALFGVGLNVTVAPPVPRTPFVPAVGCLADAGVKATLIDVALGVLSALAARVRELGEKGPAPLVDAYRRASLVMGREVCVFDDRATAAAPLAHPIARGVACDIADDLSLRLEGRAAPVSDGRLAFVEDLPPEGGLTP
jgi:biotin-(acetyl-CoA carboxylase) ligase